MCGIFGARELKPDCRVSEEVLYRMGQVIAHRGPDDHGHYCSDEVAIGMRRLSIIDVESGHQPIPNEDTTVWAVCKEGHVVGFTVATVSPSKKSLFFYPLPEIVRGIASKPVPVIQNSLARFRAPQTKAKLDRSMTDFRFSNNRIMAVAKSANGSGVDLMLAFERAAEQRGTKAYFHVWEARH